MLKFKLLLGEIVETDSKSKIGCKPAYRFHAAHTITEARMHTYARTYARTHARGASDNPPKFCINEAVYLAIYRNLHTWNVS